jgi:hypothetical protein
MAHLTNPKGVCPKVSHKPGDRLWACLQLAATPDDCKPLRAAIARVNVMSRTSPACNNEESMQIQKRLVRDNLYTASRKTIDDKQKTIDELKKSNRLSRGNAARLHTLHTEAAAKCRELLLLQQAATEQKQECVRNAGAANTKDAELRLALLELTDARQANTTQAGQHERALCELRTQVTKLTRTNEAHDANSTACAKKDAAAHLSLVEARRLNTVQATEHARQLRDMRAQELVHTKDVQAIQASFEQNLAILTLANEGHVQRVTTLTHDHMALQKNYHEDTRRITFACEALQQRRSRHCTDLVTSEPVTSEPVTSEPVTSEPVTTTLTKAAVSSSAKESRGCPRRRPDSSPVSSPSNSSLSRRKIRDSMELAKDLGGKDDSLVSWYFAAFCELQEKHPRMFVQLKTCVQSTTMASKPDALREMLHTKMKHCRTKRFREAMQGVYSVRRES